MAGFDPETQHSGRWPGGLRADAGVFDLSGGSSTVDVPTTMSKVMGAIAVAEFTATTGSMQQTLIAYKVGDASDGKVTFSRGGGSIQEDARLSYLVWGF